MPGAKTILGIDLRVASVKVVEIVVGKESLSLLNSARTEVPSSLLHNHPDLEVAKGEALKNLIQTNKIRAREAFVVVAGKETVIRVFTMRAMPRKEISEAIRLKFSEEVPYPIEEAIVDFYPLPMTDVNSEKMDFVAVCINRNLYEETRSVLNKAGIKLAGITVLPEALFDLFKYEIKLSESRITSIIYMGKRTTNISIFRNGNFEFNREMNIGEENIILAMAGVLVSPEGKIEVTPEQAEKIVTNFGLPVDLETYPRLPDIPLGQLQAMVRPALEKIVSEIARTFEYFKGQTGEAAVNRIILTGGGSTIINLREYIQEALGIPVESPELPYKLDQRFSAALGAALVGAQKINLLPEEVKQPFKPLVNRLLKPQGVLLVFTAFLFLIYSLFWLQSFMLQNELAAIASKMREYKPQLEMLKVFEQTAEKERLREQALKQYEGRRQKYARLLKEISRGVPSSICLETLQADESGLRLWGLVFKTDSSPENLLSAFMLEFSRLPLLGDVQLIQAQENNDFNRAALRFEISAKMKEQ